MERTTHAAFKDMGGVEKTALALELAGRLKKSPSTHSFWISTARQEEPLAHTPAVHGDRHPLPVPGIQFLENEQELQRNYLFSCYATATAFSFKAIFADEVVGERNVHGEEFPKERPGCLSAGRRGDGRPPQDVSPGNSNGTEAARPAMQALVNASLVEWNETNGEEALFLLR